MQLLEDNELIFNKLDALNQLPRSFSFESVYSFMHYGDFSLVIYTPAGREKRFILFTINDFGSNTHELNGILLWLQDRIEQDSSKIWEKAMDEVNRMIGAGGNKGRYFDAH